MAAKRKTAVEWVATAKLTPYDRNSRTHSNAQLKLIESSITEFGWTNPILVDEALQVLAGHGRLMAAQSLGLTEVPVLRHTGLTEAQKRAYVIADNKIAEEAGWDRDLLGQELSWLQEQEFDLGLTGFSLKDLDDLLGTELPAEDESDSLRQDYAIILDCSGESQQLELLDEFERRGLKCRALV